MPRRGPQISHGHLPGSGLAPNLLTGNLETTRALLETMIVHLLVFFRGRGVAHLVDLLLGFLGQCKVVGGDARSSYLDILRARSSAL